ncbi:MAG TPA: hydroxymethylbilane synthase [Tepidisphaeraceae bacterium]|jgi:hydroxymethylbilane synthase
MPDPASSVLRLGTRGSLLARAQSGLVAQSLERLHPGLKVELVLFRTSGDQIAERPLHEFGGKGLFTKELEQALLDGAIDFAVHSFKDVPVTIPLVDQADLITAAVPAREDPRDMLVTADGRALRDLPQGARVGTGSLRRRSQLLALRPDLRVELIRGNIDTRLRKCRSGEYGAVILALAGLRRAGLLDSATMSVIDPGQMLPAPGQGALSLQCRREDQRTRDYLAALNDPVSASCVSAERELVRLLAGDCHSPIAALAEPDGAEGVRFNAAVGAREGNPPVLRAGRSVKLAQLPAAAGELFSELAALGAPQLLAGK